MTTTDGTPPRSPSQEDSEPSLILPKVRSPEKAAGARPASDFGLPFRRSNASLSAFFASNSASSLSKRASSPIPRLPPSHSKAESAFASPTPHGAEVEENEYKSLIVRSFAPHIAVLPSPDTEELLAQKGLPAGLLSLLRPFGENVHGKVTIRDSAGSSKSCDDYAVHFGRLKDGLNSPRLEAEDTEPRIGNIDGYLDQQNPHSSARLRTGGDVDFIEDVTEKHFLYSDLDPPAEGSDRRRSSVNEPPQTPSQHSTAYHLFYLRRLLSGIPLSPHESFSHPVACVLAASSRSDDPIEELRQLHTNSRSGGDRLPQWVTNEYLRYYVLVHDEEHDDPQRSTMLFEQMKRHFGLHCHLLRIRSTQCVPSDDDCVRLPVCQWISAAEELSEIQRREALDDIDADNGPCIYASDYAAVRTMVRELVTQSVIPLMERLSTTWNDQIVSRRRGISGRFLSLSKKWTPFGSSGRNISSPFGSSSASNNTTNPASNYDPIQNHYLPDTPEAIMRKLADYAFMLRDYKLAHSTYDLIRTDYSNDKAWKYHAGAAEMTALTSLLLPYPSLPSSKSRSSSAETLDQLMESACYSYITRAQSPFHALRALAVGSELLSLRGPPASDEAARWTAKILELKLVGPIGSALFTERIAGSCALRHGTGSQKWGSRRRKAAFWSLLATEAWLGLERNRQAEACLSECVKLYDVGSTDEDDQIGLPFALMNTHLLRLRDAVRNKTGADVVNVVGLEVQQATGGRSRASTIASVNERETLKPDDEMVPLSADGTGKMQSNKRGSLIISEPLEGLPLQHAADKPDIRRHRRSMSRINVANTASAQQEPGVSPVPELKSPEVDDIKSEAVI